jgi:hypothetical protein
VNRDYNAHDLLLAKDHITALETCMRRLISHAEGMAIRYKSTEDRLEAHRDLAMAYQLLLPPKTDK